MRVSQRKLPEDDDRTLVQKAGGVLGKVAKLAVGVYAAKKIGGGLKEVGEGLKAHNDDSD